MFILFCGYICIPSIILRESSIRCINIVVGLFTSVHQGEAFGRHSRKQLILFVYEQVELMGGHLTVSSKEHYGSTFTFVLPYKVSPVCDSSNDPDEMSNMANHDVPDDANDDDLHSGIFLFPPRTLGSLFSTQVSGRTQKFSPPSYGSNASTKCSGVLDSYSFPSYNITSKENSSVKDVGSVGGSIETLHEAETSLRYSSDSDSPSTSANHEQCKGETSEVIVSQDVTCNTNRSSEGSSSNTPEIPKSELKAKILLVEDNKINVMVTKSMMKQLGHCIDVVNNGAEAVRAVQCNSYDLILMVRIKKSQRMGKCCSILVTMVTSPTPLS